MVLRWADVRKFELNGFGDASEKGYRSCVYLRALKSDGHWSCSLIMAKAKVAPIKCITLPRLEFLGSLLTAQLTIFVKTALTIPHAEVHCWTDSAVCLSWIQGDPKRWKTFVCNRVTEIQRLTSVMWWNHCAGKGNPADLTTRGLHAN